MKSVHDQVIDGHIFISVQNLECFANGCAIYNTGR